MTCSSKFSALWILPSHLEHLSAWSRIHGGLWETLKATGKGGVIGAATGGAGAFAGKGLAAVGASAPLTSIGRAAAEVAAMPSAAGALEGRLPHPQEFVDAALFIGVMHGVNGIRTVPDIVPKLRDIYAKLGKAPEEVARAAQEDQTVNQDILSVNRDVPETFIRDIEQETIYNDSRSVKVEAVKTGEDFSLEDRPQLRAYLESINPEEVRAMKYRDPDQYLAVLKDMVSELFPEGAELRFATKDGVYDYRHFLSDATRQDYIATLPKTLKDTDVRIEFTTTEGAEKAYLIKKFFDPDIQKDIWDMLVIRDGALIAKIARKEKSGRNTIESTMLRSGTEASQPDTAAGSTESASTRTTLPVEQDSMVPGKVNPDTLQRSGSGTFIPVDPAKPVLPETPLSSADAIPLSSVVESIAKALNVPIRTGKMGSSGRGASGIYKITPGVIRSRTANDIAVIMPRPGTISFGESVQRLRTRYVKGSAQLYWWKSDGRRNEALDCRVYACAALHGLLSLGLNLNRRADALPSIPEDRVRRNDVRVTAVVAAPTPGRRRVVSSNYI
jgi:hypothetical protein